MNKTLAELEDGFRGEITVLLLQVNKGVTAKEHPICPFNYKDKTGSMDAKCWNVQRTCYMLINRECWLK